VNDNEFIEEEFDLGVFIKDELIPYSLEYYLGIVDDEEEDEEGECEDEEEDEDEGKKDKKGKKEPKKLF